MSRPHHASNQEGFTIVELMIATVVLTVILLLVTVMIIAIGNIYYKGINESRIQDTTRSITSDLSQHLQLSQNISQTAAGTNPGAVCIDTTRYSYVTGTNIGTDLGGGNTQQHVLWRDTIVAGSPCLPVSLTVTDPDNPTDGGANPGVAGSGSELVSSDSRLTAFSVSSASPFTILIGVAFGDPALTTGSGVNTVCAGDTGDQFCATASLTTTVLQRITGTGN